MTVPESTRPFSSRVDKVQCVIFGWIPDGILHRILGNLSIITVLKREADTFFPLWARLRHFFSIIKISGLTALLKRSSFLFRTFPGVVSTCRVAVSVPGMRVKTRHIDSSIVRQRGLNSVPSATAMFQNLPKPEYDRSVKNPSDPPHSSGNPLQTTDNTPSFAL